MINIGYHPGYEGAFSTDQVEGAIPNGTRIVKQNSEPGDANPDGTTGVVLGSIDARPLFDELSFLYFVEWDTSPGVAVGLVDYKISRC